MDLEFFSPIAEKLLETYFKYLIEETCLETCFKYLIEMAGCRHIACQNDRILPGKLSFNYEIGRDLLTDPQHQN